MAAEITICSTKLVVMISASRPSKEISRGSEVRSSVDIGVTGPSCGTTLPDIAARFISAPTMMVTCPIASPTGNTCSQDSEG